MHARMRNGWPLQGALDQPVGPPLRATAPHCASPPALRVTGINIDNGVHGRGRGAGSGG